jgi:hypothetical protein
MTESEIESRPKLYSANIINIATFLGGPLAGALLVRTNLINLSREKQALNALIVGIVSTVLLIFSLYFSAMDKVPRYVIPLVYTAVTAFVVEKIMGRLLRSHKEANGPTYSNWRAIGISLGCFFIFLIAALAIDLFSPLDTTFDDVAYNKYLTEFSANEEKAMTLNDQIDHSPPDSVLAFISNVGIPAWKKNLDILKQIEEMPGLQDDFRARNEMLNKYCLLRIETFDLIYKGINEGNLSYNDEINTKNKKIEDLLKELKK